MRNIISKVQCITYPRPGRRRPGWRQWQCAMAGTGRGRPRAFFVKRISRARAACRGLPPPQPIRTRHRGTPTRPTHAPHRAPTACSVLTFPLCDTCNMYMCMYMYLGPFLVCVDRGETSGRSSFDGRSRHHTDAPRADGRRSQGGGTSEVHLRAQQQGGGV